MLKIEELVCSCGAEFKKETDAILHVIENHVRKDAEKIGRGLYDRIQQMVSHPGRELEIVCPTVVY